MHTLDPLTATQLHAGSTLNRPAAVIRELIDNALDAQASIISIYLDSHGRLRVHDNGIGIRASDLPLAFQRHTTTKLTQYDDLVTLTTLGFRGEALAAIAAVARVTCISRTATCERAHEIRIAGGEIHDIRPCAGTVGTDITIERLYHAIPHRRHFWRQPQTERQHILDVCIQYALIYPSVAFRVYDNATTQLATDGNGSSYHAVACIWPHIQAHPIDARLDPQTSVTGYIAHDVAPSRRQQIIAINRRPIGVRGFFAHLLDELLPPHRNHHPTAVLHFTIPHEHIDINVRSNKDELGIRTPSTIARLLYAAMSTHTPPAHTPIALGSIHLPTLTYIGRHKDWHIWSSVEGIVIMNPANVMHACHIKNLDAGMLCVPPYPLDTQTATLFTTHASHWQAYGLELAYNHQQQLCITRLPHSATTTALDSALAACVRTMRNGGTFAMGIGHLLDPQWLYTCIQALPNPWAHHAIWMISHQRLADALRMPHGATAILDQSP